MNPVLLGLSIIVMGSFLGGYTLETIRGNVVDTRLEYQYNDLKILYKLVCDKKPPLHTVQVKLLNMDILGQCQPGTFRNVITINEEFLNTASNDYVMTILAHEMSHCFLNNHHKNDHDNYMDATPRSDLGQFKLYIQFVRDVYESCKD